MLRPRATSFHFKFPILQQVFGLLFPLFVIATLLVTNVRAQGIGLQFRPGCEPYIIPGDLRLEYVRYLQLLGDAPIDPLVIQPVSRASIQAIYEAGPWQEHFRKHAVETGDTGARWGIIPVRWISVYNSSYPYSTNDGVMWSGKGLSSRLDFGTYLTVGPLSIQFAPSLYFSQNQAFDLVTVEKSGFSPYINPWHQGRIDYPQRFGDESISGWDWGQSYLQLEYKGIALGYGTENMWWGPARQNPILMSNTSAGFPHLSLGTTRPVNLLLGRWEMRMFAGSLSESKWFDDNTGNDSRLFAAVVADWQPSFIPGLTVGGARSFIQYPPDGVIKLRDYLIIFEPFFMKSKVSKYPPHGDDDKDQYLSFFSRWVFPESGFEAYVEWARNDQSWDLRDFLLEPDHSRAYTVGIQKLFNLSPAIYRLAMEWTQLGRSMTILVRESPTYYRHHKVIQGYTHEGQLLGAGIGPGSESQYASLARLASWGMCDLSLTRIRWYNDAMYSLVAPEREHAYRDHDVSYIFSLGGLLFNKVVNIAANVAYIREFNRNFVRNSDVTNMSFTLSLSRFF